MSYLDFIENIPLSKIKKYSLRINFMTTVGYITLNLVCYLHLCVRIYASNLTFLDVWYTVIVIQLHKEADKTKTPQSNTDV